MPRVLILSTTTGYQLRSFGDAAAAAGIDLVFATDRCHTLDDPWRDGAIPVRFHEEDASVATIVEAAKSRPIDGVLPVGDRPVVIAARAARALGLRGNPPEAARASTSKRLARDRFAAAGLPVPWFLEFPHDSVEDPRLRYPCVVKPLGLSGSRGVIRADNRRELDAAMARVRALLSRKDVRAARTGLEDSLLVEGFIHGREFAIEGVVTGGLVRVFAVFAKPDPLDGPFFEETIYVTPSGLQPDVEAAVCAQVQRAVSALGLTDGPLHAECRVGPDGIFILEVAARPIGGLCARVLQFVSPPGRESDAGPANTLPLEDVLLQHALGKDISGYVREAQAAAVMMIPIPRRGFLKSVEGIEDARAVPGVDDLRITAKKDQLLEQLPEAGSYLGFIFARAADPFAAVSALKAAHARLVFRIGAPLPIVSS